MRFRMPNSTVYCNLHSEERSTVVEATVREVSQSSWNRKINYLLQIWQRGWDPRGDFFVPLLISCPIPHWMEGAKLSVQITEEMCASLEVILNPTPIHLSIDCRPQSQSPFLLLLRTKINQRLQSVWRDSIFRWNYHNGTKKSQSFPGRSLRFTDRMVGMAVSLRSRYRNHLRLYRIPSHWAGTAMVRGTGTDRVGGLR